MWGERGIIRDGKALRASAVLLMLYNLLLAACDSRGGGVASAASCPGSLLVLSSEEIDLLGRKTMQERLQAILRGEVKLPQPLPGSPELGIKERLNKAMVLLAFTYRVGDRTVTNYGSGVIVGKLEDGWEILTNAHVVDNEGAYPDGAWLESLRVARTFYDVLNQGGEEFAGNYVRALGSADRDEAIVRIFNIRGMYSSKLGGYEAMPLNLGASLDQAQLLWYIGAPYDFAAAMVDANLGLGRFFDSTQVDGCKLDGLARSDKPAEDGMSGTGVVNTNGEVVGLMTEIGAVGEIGQSQLMMGILDLGNEVDELRGELGKMKINEQGYMVLPLVRWKGK